MELLLILIFIFFVLPWIFQKTLPWLLRWFVRHQTKRFMNNAFGGENPYGGSRKTDRNQRTGYNRKKKKIDPSVGEYIEFTEIKGSSSTSTVKPNGPVESQITDIEWEDLP